MSRAGFCLAEVALGMGLLGIVAVSLYAALSSAFSVVQFSRENLRATQVLIEKMELVRLYSWEQITDPDFFPKHFSEVFDPEGTASGNGGMVFNGTMSVKKGPNDVDYDDDMKTVTIEIKWKNGKRNRSREFVTFVTKNGLQTYLY